VLLSMNASLTSVAISAMLSMKVSRMTHVSRVLCRRRRGCGATVRSDESSSTGPREFEDTLIIS